MSHSVLDYFLKESFNNKDIVDVDKEVCKKCFEDKKKCLEALRRGEKGKAILIGDEKVGSIWKEKNEFGHIEISGFYVHQEFRNKGYGSILLKNMDDAQVLYTEANNKIAQRTYEKNGWVKSDLIGRFDKDKKKEWYL